MSDLAPMVRLDLHSLVAQRRMFLIFVVMSAAFAFAGGVTFSMPLLAVVGMMIGLSLFGTAETNKLTMLYGSLPVRRRTVMVSHYLVAAGMTTLAIVIGMLFAGVASVVRGESAEGLLMSGVAVVGALFVVLSFMIPLQVRFGAMTGSFVALAVTMVISGIVGFGLGQEALAGLLASLNAAGPWLVAGLVAVGLVGLAVSVLVSIRIYERQDH